MGLIRKSWADSGQLFTEFGIQYRGVRNDQLGVVGIIWISLHAQFLRAVFSFAEHDLALPKQWNDTLKSMVQEDARFSTDRYGS